MTPRSPPTNEGAVAWLLEWRNEEQEPHDRRRVQLTTALDQWMTPADITLTPLYAHPHPVQDAEMREKVAAAVEGVLYGYDGRLLTGDFWPGREAIIDAILAALPAVGEKP